MYFWLKLLHVVAMSIWFAALFLLPGLVAAAARDAARAAEPAADGGGFAGPAARMLSAGVATPAAVIAIALGMVLIAFGPQGAWLIAKLALVALAVGLHLHAGTLLERAERGRAVGRWRRLAAGWSPLVLLLAAAALTGAKPQSAFELPPPPAVAAGERR